MSQPAYRRLSAAELKMRAVKAKERLSPCDLCPRCCRASRLKGRKGVCGGAAVARISGYGPHFGEEKPLVGSQGSGTIFFTGCSLKCIYCQNWEISQEGHGYNVDEERLAQVMLELQEKGCHNINLVTPTHYTPQILGSLALAREKGLAIPLVWNSSGYDKIDVLKLLDGIIDIYMPDVKYWRTETAAALSAVPDYPDVVRAALKEMHRQVGDLVIDEAGIARRGLIVRHLVLPGHVDESIEILAFLARELSPDVYVNIMEQYRPEYRAGEREELRRPLRFTEYDKVIQEAKRLGLYRFAH